MLAFLFSCCLCLSFTELVLGLNHFKIYTHFFYPFYIKWVKAKNICKSGVSLNCR